MRGLKQGVMSSPLGLKKETDEAVTNGEGGALNQRYLNTIMSEDDVSSLTVATLNAWGMPFGSHAVLSRPAKLATAYIEHVAKGKPLASRHVLCIQEAWGFKCGLGGPGLHLARHLERFSPRYCTAVPTNTFDDSKLLSEIWRVNSCCTLMALLCGLATSLCVPLPWLRYDQTRADLLAALRPYGLRHATGVGGTAGMSWSCRKLMDSGLLILSTEAPVSSGFVGYEAPLAEEASVHKGVLWALFEGGMHARPSCAWAPIASIPAGVHMHLTPPPAGAHGGRELVLTTHTHATSPEIRAAQRRQLGRLVADLKERFHPALIILCGDMNEEAAVLTAELGAPPLAMSRLSKSTPGGTCVSSDGSTKELDHIFAVADTGSGRELAGWSAHPPVRTPLSDHSLLWVSGIS